MSIRTIKKIWLAKENIIFQRSKRTYPLKSYLAWKKFGTFLCIVVYFTRKFESLSSPVRNGQSFELSREMSLYTLESSKLWSCNIRLEQDSNFSVQPTGCPTQKFGNTTPCSERKLADWYWSAQEHLVNSKSHSKFAKIVKRFKNYQKSSYYIKITRT